MIRIEGARDLGSKITIAYNPISDLSLALDLLSHPEHHRVHEPWTSSVLEALSAKEKNQLERFGSEMEGYLNLDLLYDYSKSLKRIPSDPYELSLFLKDPLSLKNEVGKDLSEQLGAFLSFMWESYIFPVVREHRDVIERQIQYGYELLRKRGQSDLFSEISDRVSFTPSGDLKMEKWVESRFPCRDLHSFFVEPSLFAFPHMVISDEHEQGSFMLSWDVPFRGDRIIAPGINRISLRAFALSDKSRLRILLMLSGSPMAQRELARQMGFAKSTISRHVNILLEAELIRAGEGERNVLLYINNDVLDDFASDVKSWLRTS